MRTRKWVTKACAGVLAAAVSFGSAAPAMAATSSPVNPPVIPPTPMIKTDDAQWTLQVYKNGRTKVLFKPEATNKKTYELPKNVTINGITCEINELGAYSLDKLDNVTEIVLPNSITKLNAKSFAGCKKLKTIVFKKGKRFPVIREGAFKGLKTKKMTAKISKKYNKRLRKTITKRLRSKGFKGKIVFA